MPDGPQRSSTAPPRPTPDPPRWPGLIGFSGIAVATLIFVDKVEDLLTPWLSSREAWRHRFTADISNLVAETIPPMEWTLPATAVGVGLAVLLLVGSIGVLRRRRGGVRLCRTWAWLAILWGLAEIIVATVLLQRLALEAPELAADGWAGAVSSGVFLALFLILTFPVFLLLWFRREAVRREYAGWAA